MSLTFFSRLFYLLSFCVLSFFFLSSSYSTDPPHSYSPTRFRSLLLITTNHKTTEKKVHSHLQEKKQKKRSNHTLFPSPYPFHFYHRTQNFILCKKVFFLPSLFHSSLFLFFLLSFHPSPLIPPTRHQPEPQTTSSPRPPQGQHIHISKMTALSSEAHNGATNGYTNGSAEHNNNNHSTTEVSGSPAFANNAFSHLTLYTGNTMRTGTTGQLNTSLKKSNQEVRTTNPILFFGREGIQADRETMQEEKKAGKLWKMSLQQPSLDSISRATYTEPPGR